MTPHVCTLALPPRVYSSTALHASGSLLNQISTLPCYVSVCTRVVITVSTWHGSTPYNRFSPSYCVLCLFVNGPPCYVSVCTRVVITVSTWHGSTPYNRFSPSYCVLCLFVNGPHAQYKAAAWLIGLLHPVPGHNATGIEEEEGELRSM